MRQADISPHRVFPPAANVTVTLDNGPMLYGTTPDFNPPPPSLQRIPSALQDMIDAEEKAAGKRGKRR